MNKTLLLIIVDFLFLNLIALTRWEKAEPIRTRQLPVNHVSGNAATKEQDLVEVMRQSLTDEQASREQLAQRLSEQSGKLSAREQSLTQAQMESSRLSAALSENQKAQADLQQRYTDASQEANLTRDQLERLEHELDEKRAEADRQRRALSDLQKQQATDRKQIEGLTVAVMVGDQQNKSLQAQTAQLQGQVQSERAERLKVEQSTDQIAQGVGQLAQNSGELTKEIRENQPINANILYNDFLSDRVTATIDLERKGVFGKVVRNRSTPTVFTTDGNQVYAVAHADDVGLPLDELSADWRSLQIGFSRPTGSRVDGSELRFLAIDPRVIAVPVSAEQVASLGAKVYPLAKDRFRFPDAVLINVGGKGYGEVGFKLDPDHPGYVRVDNRFFKRLFGDFAPSRGDLVLSKSGELLGVMVNSNYCALLGDFSPLATLHTGDVSSDHTGALIQTLGTRVMSMPLELQ